MPTKNKITKDIKDIARLVVVFSILYATLGIAIFKDGDTVVGILGVLSGMFVLVWTGHVATKVGKDEQE